MCQRFFRSKKTTFLEKREEGPGRIAGVAGRSTMVKLKIKIPLSGWESTGSAAAAGPSSQPSELKAALPKIVIKASQAKAKEENTKEVGEGGRPSGARERPHSSGPPSTSDLTQQTQQQKRTAAAASKSVTTFPEHNRVSDYRLAGFDQLASNVAEQAYRSLQELLINASGADVGDEDRKRLVLRYANEQRQRLIRLLVLASWHKAEANKVSVAQQCMALLQDCETFNLGLRTASDNLAILHDDLRMLFQPRYDVGTAVGLLCEGRLPEMPTSMRDLASAGAEERDGRESNPRTEEEAALRRLETLAYKKLLGVRDALEADFATRVQVKRGRAHLTSDGLFELVLTLNPMAVRVGGAEADRAEEWTLVSAEVLLRSSGGQEVLSPAQTRAMTFQLQRSLGGEGEKGGVLALAAAMAELCSKLVIYTCSSQLNRLVADPAGRLRGLVQKEDSTQSGLLRCRYWLEPKRRSRTFVELGLATGGRYACRNVFVLPAEDDGDSPAAAALELPLALDTTRISVEEAVWRAAGEMASRVAARLADGLRSGGGLNRGGGPPLEVSVEDRGTVRLSLACVEVLTASVDVLTGALMLSQGCGSDFVDPRAIAQFRRRHEHLLACCPEVLGGGQHLSLLSGHLCRLAAGLCEGKGAAMAATAAGASRKRKLQEVA